MGNTESRPRSHADRRFIPTHVGNTPPSDLARPQPSVHPHARGEHHELGNRHTHVGGSSPRTWGTRRRQIAWLGCSRFIPTHVGNTSWSRSCARRSPVHPHARGEHHCDALRVESRCGSSPRTWGTLVRSLDRLLKGRFIPTHVGNT